jgi:hypothetical protein
MKRCGGGVWESKFTPGSIDRRTFVWWAISMLATQDVQVSAEGEALWEELRLELHEVDLKLLHAADLAARYAATKHYDEQGYASPIDSIRLTCHLTAGAAAVGTKFEEPHCWRRRGRTRRASSITSATTTGTPLTARALRRSGRRWWRIASSLSAPAKTAPSC